MSQALQFVLGAGEGALEAALGLPKTVEEGDLDAGAGVFAVDFGLREFHASEFPLGDSHLLDIEKLGAGAGLPLGFEVVAELVEVLTGFAGEDEFSGPEAVAKGVHGAGGLALRGARAGGPLGITAVGLDLFFSCHMRNLTSKANSA
jgi:hypothetical protein